MKAVSASVWREAVALLLAAGVIAAVPSVARSEDVVIAAPRVIFPEVRLGGIPQGQILQITERGSEMVAAMQVAAITGKLNPNAKVVVVAATDIKPAPKLFCAGAF
jgi:hypothetical protein